MKNEKRIPKEDTPLVAVGGLKPPTAKPPFYFSFSGFGGGAVGGEEVKVDKIVSCDILKSESRKVGKLENEKYA